MPKFEINKTGIKTIAELIENGSDKQLLKILKDVHYADIAEIIDELPVEGATYLIKLLDSEKMRMPSLRWTKTCVKRF